MMVFLELTGLARVVVIKLRGLTKAFVAVLRSGATNILFTSKILTIIFQMCKPKVNKPF